jgi:hypothetical protein
MLENVGMVVDPEFPSDQIRDATVWFQKGRGIFSNQNVFSVKKVAIDSPGFACRSVIRK